MFGKVKHNKYGEGMILKREGNQITVRFEQDNSERIFSIPQSVNLGLLEVDATLQQEIEQLNKANMERKAEDMTRILSQLTVTAGLTSHRSPKRHTTSNVTCAVKNDFAKFLIDSGYQLESKKGDKSTVFYYLNAIEKILIEEKMTWQDLKTEIGNIKKIYDANGAKHKLGLKGHSTWINALRRFEEFISNAA